MARADQADAPPRSTARVPDAYNLGNLAEILAELLPTLSPAQATSRSEATPDGWSAHELEEARKAAENLARRESDLELVNSMALASFSGPIYDGFIAELAAYGYPVMLSWLRRPVIFRLCGSRGRPLHPSDADLELLASNYEERLGLVGETVAEALKLFRDQALLARKWDYNGGASLKTYFMGACVFAFPNVFRRWQRERRHWYKALHAEVVGCVDESRSLSVQATADPADVAVARVTVTRELQAMSSSARPAAALVMDGLTQAETAAELGLTERAVEGRLYRLRTQFRDPRRRKENRT